MASLDADLDPRPTGQHISLQEATVQCFLIVNKEGEKVSLVAENGLVRGSKIKRHILKIHGIAGNVMETKGQSDLRIGETSSHEFMVVENLPMNCDILLGQDWLERFGYQFQIPDLGKPLGY